MTTRYLSDIYRYIVYFLMTYISFLVIGMRIIQLNEGHKCVHMASQATNDAMMLNNVYISRRKHLDASANPEKGNDVIKPKDGEITIGNVSIDVYKQSQSVPTKSDMPFCTSANKNYLVGDLKVDLDVPSTIANATKSYEDLDNGGGWKPRTCISTQKIVILIPFRDRHAHLEVLLFYLIPILKRQMADFRIFVVEQWGKKAFNKGKVMNAGFKEISTKINFDCVIFHDVDLVPENDKNMYTCDKFPRHMSPEVDKFNYRLLYKSLIGGVLSMNKETFHKVNGYSNLFWGWGGEDDEMARRLLFSNIKITRPPNGIGKYKMIKHSNRALETRRYSLLKTMKKRYREDGLNSIEYHVMFVNDTKRFTHIMVNVGEQ